MWNGPLSEAVAFQHGEHPERHQFVVHLRRHENEAPVSNGALPLPGFQHPRHSQKLCRLLQVVRTNSLVKKLREHHRLLEAGRYQIRSM